MLAVWLDDNKTSSTVRDVTVLTLHVLTHALFGGKSHNFRNELEIQFQDGTMKIRDALSTILNNIIYVFIIPNRFLSLPFLPKKFRLLDQAIRAFNTYVAEMIEK